MARAVALVMAHGGGWDEIGVVLAPILLFAVLLSVANRRAAKLGLQDDDDDDLGIDGPPLPSPGTSTGRPEGSVDR